MNFFFGEPLLVYHPRGMCFGGAAAGTVSGLTASEIATASTVASAVGTAAGVAGSLEQASAAQKAAQANANIATQNQAAANNNATAAIQAGEAQTGAQSLKTKANVGAIMAGEAASGVDVNSGSAVDVRSSAASLGELNAINIRSNAARTAYGYETQGIGYAGQAQLDTLEAANAGTAGDIGAGTTFLGGAGNAGLNYAKFLNSGAINSGGGTGGTSSPGLVSVDGTQN